MPRHHATSEVIFDSDELEFLKAMDIFKSQTGKKFPTWTDALKVLRGLGWSKDAPWAEDLIRMGWEDELPSMAPLEGLDDLAMAS